MSLDSRSSADQGANLGFQFLEEILSLAHPLMAEAITVSAIPHWYDLPLFTAVRAVDDGRNEGLIPRLASYSFVIPIPNDKLATYRLRTGERRQLNHRWIESDLAAYLAAHGRAFAYCNSFAGDNSEEAETPFLHNSLYHRFFVDFVRATDELIQLFRTYSNERHLAAIENMLDMVAEAHGYLQLIHQRNTDERNSNERNAGNGAGSRQSGGSSAREKNSTAISSTGSDTGSTPVSAEELVQFDELIRYLRARLAQLHGNWEQSLALLTQLRSRDELSPVLLPFVTRAYGNTLAQKGDYVGAIHELETSISQFDERLKIPDSAVDSGTIGRSTTLTADNSETERAYAMIDLGEIYMKFAVSARGGTERGAAGPGLWRYVQALFDFVISGPLIIYLGAFLGMRVLHPRFWPTLRNLDWMIARLFATGARYFQYADPILERIGTPTEGVLADERLAFLFLNMGDAAQAKVHFDRLLAEDDAPLGDYHRAGIQVGLSEAYLRLDQPELAVQLLHETLPNVQAFADRPLEAQSEALLTEALLLTGEHSAAKLHLEAAIDQYVVLDEIERATNLVERCDALAQLNSSAPNTTDDGVSADKEAASVADGDYRQFGQRLPYRQYSVGYRHPALVLFRRLVVFLLPLAVVLALLSSIQLDTDISLIPTIEFRAAPLLDPSDSAPAELSQGFTAATLSVDPNPNSLLPWALSALTGYMGLSLLMGVCVIAFTSLASVQESGQTSTVRVDDDGLTEGEGEERQSLLWADVLRFARADVRIWREIIPSSSSFGLDTATDRVVIGGTAKWYAGLQREVVARLPASAYRINLGYSVIRTALGVLYLLNLAVLVFVALFAWLNADSRLLWQDLVGVYSIVDLYPYLYAGLFLFPLWWGVVRPLHIISHLGERGRQAWGNIICALLILAVLVLLFFRPLLTVPDLYPALIVLVALFSAGSTIWILQVGGKRIHPLWRRGLLVLLLALPCLLLAGIVQREVRSYHFLVVGNTFRDRGQADELSQDDANSLNERAIGAYTRSVEIGRSSIGPFSGDRMIKHPLGFSNQFGIPQLDSVSWLSALKNRAALQAQQQNVDEATADYDLILEFTDKPDQVYAWKAMAQQRAATVETDSNEVEIETNNRVYNQAVADYTRAIEINPDNPQYYLWRGATYHAIGGTNNLRLALEDYETVLVRRLDATAKTRERAYSGIGWVLYDTAENSVNQEDRISLLEEAENAFIQATLEDSKKAEAWLGLGYARYSSSERSGESADEAIERLKKAQKAWERASREDPQDPVVLISLGTLHWKMGGKLRSSGLTIEGCDEYLRSNNYFTEATDRDALRPQTDHDVAFTYRTRGQIFFLLGLYCNGLNDDLYNTRAANYRLGALSYEEAIALEPSANYLHMRARLNYVHLIVAKPRAADVHELILEILSDMNRALEIDPVDYIMPHIDYKPNRFSRAIVPWAFTQARQLLQLGLGMESQAVYTETISLANKIEGGIDRIDNEVSTLVDHLRKYPSPQGEEIMQQLRGAISALDGTTSNAKLGMGIFALNSNQSAEAESLLVEGIDLAIQEGNIVAVASTIAKLHIVETAEAARVGGDAEAEEASATFSFDIDAVEDAARGTQTPEDALAQALLFAIEGNWERSAIWYSEAFGRAATTNRTGSFSRMKVVTRELTAIWQQPRTESKELLEQLEIAQADLFTREPNLQCEGVYWLDRAWFQGLIAYQLFLADEEQLARSILEVAQPDADQAAELGEVGVDVVDTYFQEGALGWYYLERGNNHFKANSFEKALNDYQDAVSAFQPVTNDTARRERVEAAFKAGKAALVLSELALAQEWYSRGIELAQEYKPLSLDSALEKLNAKISTAISELKDLDMPRSVYEDDVTRIIQRLEDL